MIEPELGGVLSGFADQSIATGCYCFVKVHSNYGSFNMLVELVLGRRNEDGDFEVRSCLSGVLGFDTNLSQQKRRNGGA